GEHVDGEGQVRAANRLPVAGLAPPNVADPIVYLHHHHPGGHPTTVAPHTNYVNIAIIGITPADEL
ncbi:hypothetical protein, partial [Enterobacter asburiae]